MRRKRHDIGGPLRKRYLLPAEPKGKTFDSASSLLEQFRKALIAIASGLSCSNCLCTCGDTNEDVSDAEAEISRSRANTADLLRAVLQDALTTMTELTHLNEPYAPTEERPVSTGNPLHTTSAG